MSWQVGVCGRDSLCIAFALYTSRYEIETPSSIPKRSGHAGESPLNVTEFMLIPFLDRARS